MAIKLARATTRSVMSACVRKLVVVFMGLIFAGVRAAVLVADYAIDNEDCALIARYAADAFTLGWNADNGQCFTAFNSACDVIMERV